MRGPDGPFRGTSTTVRRATARDADLLVAWHANPDVSRYWDDETFTREEMLSRLARPDVAPFVIEHDGVEIGYLQVWFSEAIPDEAGLDMFLIPRARGHGLGPDAARTITDWLLSPGGMRRISVDPYGSNDRAIPAWTKAGFRPLEERPPDDERAAPWLLMVAT
jgi:aminoglycoside 6'-N-acetyltransferase